MSNLHPLFVIQDLLNTYDDTLNSGEIRTILIDELKKTYSKVELLQGKIIFCENLIVQNSLTKPFLLIYIRKKISFKDIINFRNITQNLIKDKNYSRILIVKDLIESKKHFIVHSQLDYITFFEDKWHTSWQRTQYMRKRDKK